MLIKLLMEQLANYPFLFFCLPSIKRGDGGWQSLPVLSKKTGQLHSDRQTDTFSVKKLMEFRRRFRLVRTSIYEYTQDRQLSIDIRGNETKIPRAH